MNLLTGVACGPGFVVLLGFTGVVESNRAETPCLIVRRFMKYKGIYRVKRRQGLRKIVEIGGLG